MILERDAAVSVVAESGGEQETLRQVVAHHVDVVVLEARSLSLIRALCRVPGRRPAAVVYGVSGDAHQLVGLVRADVASVVHEDAPHDDLRRAVHAAANGDGFASSALTGALLRAVRNRSRTVLRLPRDVQFTQRERDVLRHLLRGQANKDIAAALSVSEKTVKFHVSNVLAKAGLTSRAQLIASLAAPAPLEEPARTWASSA